MYMSLDLCSRSLTYRLPVTDLGNDFFFTFLMTVTLKLWEDIGMSTVNIQCFLYIFLLELPLLFPFKFEELAKNVVAFAQILCIVSRGDIRLRIVCTLCRELTLVYAVLFSGNGSRCRCTPLWLFAVSHWRIDNQWQNLQMQEKLL